jgi:hypothetical protein
MAHSVAAMRVVGRAVAAGVPSLKRPGIIRPFDEVDPFREFWCRIAVVRVKWKAAAAPKDIAKELLLDDGGPSVREVNPNG